ncbi:MAG: polysaccharide biosynthesis protein, partial [Actinomycetales bacterium]|nr:polysaccharide biosynthesis protein [Actinomycetales bacterium]
IGAGDGGRDLVRSMHGDPMRAWDPVAFLDDDPLKRHFRFQGVTVQGGSDDLESVAEKLGVTSVVIAMPSISSSVIRRINDAAIHAGLDVKVLPGVNDILGNVTIEQVRDIEPADLLGRHQISTDLDAIADYLRDKTVLVTGAGGSIGSELCRQIRRFAPARLAMLDRDESALHALALSMDGRADLESPDMVLADIRDRDRMLEVFTSVQPDVVFHAAALKHVNMLEHQPGEAFKTNVLGTQNVLDAAVAAHVSRFVNISTDKAASPENALGYSKRLAEGLTAGVGHSAEGTYLSVRFGNVLGTRGSVLTTFQAQIDRGGPITVTHPDVTRFFMTVGEAVQLVIQAAAIGRDGEALVLDMGEPVKIDDVARQMIQQSRRSIEIVYTGLKPGEKLHEVLFASAEADERPFHSLVSHVDVPPTTKGITETIAAAPDALNAMREACDTLTAPAGE